VIGIILVTLLGGGCDEGPQRLARHDAGASSDGAQQLGLGAAEGGSVQGADAHPPGDAAPLAQQPAAALRINFGSSVPFVDSAGRTWAADDLTSDGSDGAPEGKTDRGGLPIQGTADPQLYRTEHYCMTTFHVPLASGTYTVKLHFCETWEPVTAAGQRVFDVTVMDQTLAGLDVFKETGGPLRALIKSFEHVAVTEGTLSIGFAGRVGCAEVNGLEVHAE